MLERMKDHFHNSGNGQKCGKKKLVALSQKFQFRARTAKSATPPIYVYPHENDDCLKLCERDNNHVGREIEKYNHFHCNV